MKRILLVGVAAFSLTSTVLCQAQGTVPKPRPKPVIPPGGPQTVVLMIQGALPESQDIDIGPQIFKLKAGETHAQLQTKLTASELKNLRIHYNHLICPIQWVGVSAGQDLANYSLKSVTIKLNSKMVNNKTTPVCSNAEAVVVKNT